MTRSLCKIEIAIAAAFIQHPDQSHTVAELAQAAYPNAKAIEKRHRVAVTRSADRVAAAIGWTALPIDTKPRQIAFVSLTHPASLAHCDARIGSASTLTERRLTDLEAMWRRRVVALFQAAEGATNADRTV